MAADLYDPLPDLIAYFVASRRSRTLTAGRHQQVIRERLGITDATGPDEATELLRAAAGVPDGKDWPLRCEVCAERRRGTRVVKAFGRTFVTCEVCAEGRGPARSLVAAAGDSWVIRLVRISGEEITC